MTDLLPEEEAALVAALDAEDGEVVGLSHQAMVRLSGQGFIIYHQPTRQGCLATAGQIVATLLKREARMDRAKAKLSDWDDNVRVAMVDHSFCPSATLEWQSGHGWWANLEYPATDDRHGEHSVGSVGPSCSDPLTAVIEASKRTPWPLEE